MVINGFEIYEHNYNKYEGNVKLNDLVECGMCFKFSKWLRFYDLSEDTPEDVYANTSALRDGIRLDIFDDYILDFFDDEQRYKIIFIWALENGVLYATVYDRVDDYIVGDIVIE